MAQRVFTKDTMLDLVVNIIPLGILAFFIGLFVLAGPFSWDPLYSTLMLGIIGGSFVLLTVLTYFSAIAIEGDAIASEEAGRAAHAEEKPGVEDTSETAGTESPEGTPSVTGDDAESDDRAESADSDDGEHEQVF
ncbi:DUF6684 family protein [Halorubellus sp. JP-L1]|uniref:DUF6684 family protein n=1 Tax=Halorubellus sp. JP-L1 TaxID=2715753 RepID=UPI00187880E4|nr:DUF6684 family protein [Halorubellus sp. JP-L1]